MDRRLEQTAEDQTDRDQVHDFLKEYMGDDAYATAKAKREMHTTVVEVGYLIRKFNDQQTASLKEDNENLKSVMIAAAEEIQAHWSAHCDAEGYGPANLMHRLEKGIPARYGYTAGAFARQDQRIKELENDLKDFCLVINESPLAETEWFQKMKMKYGQETA